VGAFWELVAGLMMPVARLLTPEFPTEFSFELLPQISFL